VHDTDRPFLFVPFVDEGGPPMSPSAYLVRGIAFSFLPAIMEDLFVFSHKEESGMGHFPSFPLTIGISPSATLLSFPFHSLFLFFPWLPFF